MVMLNVQEHIENIFHGNLDVEEKTQCRCGLGEACIEGGTGRIVSGDYTVSGVWFGDLRFETACNHCEADLGEVTFSITIEHEKA